jgi:hypothetical protein
MVNRQNEDPYPRLLDRIVNQSCPTQNYFGRVMAGLVVPQHNTRSTTAANLRDRPFVTVAAQVTVVLVNVCC